MTVSHQETIREISKAFNYEKKVSRARGKLWFEHYPEQLAPYAFLIVHRNERVIAAAAGGQRLLDIGCGFGDLLYLLRDRYAELVGIDPSQDMVEQTRANMAQRGLSAQIEAGIAETLEFPDEHFDTIVMLDVYEHIRPETRHAALVEVRRVLKTGGELILATPSRRMLLMWNFIDGILTIPRKLIRRQKIRLFSIAPTPFTEVFCSRRELLDELQQANLPAVHFERVGFYPAAENPGFLEPWLIRSYRVPGVHRAISGLFRCLASLRLLNQKMLVRCVKT